jgi:hypothetical protein
MRIVYRFSIKAQKRLLDNRKLAERVQGSIPAGDAAFEAARDTAYRNIRKVAFMDRNNENANRVRFRESIGL